MRNLKYRFLTAEFYQDYADCPEIEHKQGRPYAVALVHYNGLDFAIPFRSHIKHKYAFFTTPEKDKGLDYTKAVPLVKESYIDKKRIPQMISKEERAALFNKAEQVESELMQYIEAYKQALGKQHLMTYRIFCKYSCLQYFHKELDIDLKRTLLT